MEAIWDWSDRVYPAAALLAVGLALFARGIIVHFRGWRLPSNRPRKNLTIVRGMRMFLLGASLAAVGAGWLWHLPILIAAKRPRMLELTARHADLWNLAWFGEPDERLARVRGELEAACVASGRDPATLGVTVGITVRYPDLAPPRRDGAPAPEPVGPALTGSDAEIAAGLVAHAEAGARHLIAALEPATTASVERLAAAVRLAGLAGPG